MGAYLDCIPACTEYENNYDIDNTVHPNFNRKKSRTNYLKDEIKGGMHF